jgi:L-cysteine/cystine lyase
MPDYSAIRSRIPSVHERAYFNTGTFGPFPDAVREAMGAYTDRAHAIGRIGDARYAEQATLEADARAALARVVNAPVESIALTHCTSDGLNLVVSGLEWEAGDEVLVSDAEHPGLLVPLKVMGQRRGIVTTTLPLTDAPDPVQMIADALTPRTKLVALSHVLWSTGRVLPIAEIAAVVRDHGAFFAIDAAQGPGCIPVDAPALGADAYTISGQKWLCGPSGTGGLYVRPESVDRLVPAFPGYFTMERLPSGPRLWPGARRFELSTVTHTALAGLVAAIAWREEIGFAAGHARSMELADLLRAQVADLPNVEAIAVDRPSPLVALHIAGRSAVDAVAELERQDIIVRSIPGTEITRVSVGLWNDEGDVDRLVVALAAL